MTLVAFSFGKENKNLFLFFLNNRITNEILQSMYCREKKKKYENRNRGTPKLMGHLEKEQTRKRQRRNHWRTRSGFYFYFYIHWMINDDFLVLLTLHLLEYFFLKYS